MRYPLVVLLLVVAAGIFSAGCTQPAGTGTVPTTVPVATPTPTPLATETPVPAAVTTAIPETVVTVVHLISPVRDVKDSELMFALQVPEEWSISTRRIANPENFEGFMYQTDLVGNDTFYIHTFTDYRNREQNYRDQFREWSPAPAMSTATINGIVFDRFESAGDSRTRVGYVARKGMTNEQGFLSVLYFNASNANRFEKEDFEKVVSSFRYFSRNGDEPVPGEEIAKIAPPEEEGGSARSAVNSGGSSAGGSSGGGSSGGGGCRR